ncbi:hypothetical protein E2562_002978 [Oryza meyeriana var. granulata]|nr:hypothetical protein E2562_002978 [Oryza meyeriana var. granulata]
MTVLTFFISTFNGKDIYHIGSRRLLNLREPVELLDILKQESGGDNRHADDCLIELRALSLLCIFLLFPENMLDACFALIASAEDVKGEGLYFLKQLTCHLNSDTITDALDVQTDGASQRTGMDVDQPGTKESVDSKLSSHNVGVSRSSMLQPNECYMTMAISRHPSLKGWVLLRYKKLCDSCKTDVVSEVSSCLKVLGSLSQLEDNESNIGSESSAPDKIDENSGGYLQSDKLVCSSEQRMLLKTDSVDSYGGNFVQNKNAQMVRIDEVKTEKLADVKLNVCKQGTVISDAGHQAARLDSRHDSAGGATTLTSPGQNFGKAKHSYSEPSDLYGAHFSRDVISVSKELWIGSLGNSAAESLVRSKFEEFGPLANFLFYPSKNFALIEYRNIIHAVHAYGCMQGSSVWGGGLQIRYLDRLIGSKGFASGIAVGESRHIYVAKVKNKKDKDEVFDELKAAGLKRPCSFTDISSENALLLEFEMATDAAAAKAHIRHQLHSDVCCQDKNTSGHQLLVQNIDNLVPDIEFINAFSRFGEVIRWQFNKLDGNCLIDYRSPNAAATAKSHLHGARFGLKSISVESRTCSAGSVQDKTLLPAGSMLAQSVSDSSHREIRNPRVSGYNANTGFTVPTERPIYGPSPPRAPQGIPLCPPVSAHRGSVIPPPPIQTSFVRPVYPGPASPWENTTPNPPFSHASPRMMSGSSFRMNPPAPLPFIPSSVTPLTQFPGGSAQQSEKRPPPPPPNVAPPPFTRLDIPPPPPSPPPLPITQPPSVPLPPNSPPPLQPATEPSDSQKPHTHPRWQGSLSKSGLHYCTIYASRIELDACRYENTVSEPAGWPSRLDVTKRTDYQHVKTTFSNSPPSKREVCQLLPCSNGDQKGFRDFISYLKQRECAGVIKIPSVKPLWSRLLFILPPTAEACGMLKLPPHPSECLITLILPKETTAEAT